jgi:hypothetical protein
MSETLSIEKLPPSDRSRSSEANNAANLQVTSALMQLRQLYAGTMGKPIDLYDRYGFKSHTISNVNAWPASNVNAWFAFTANAYNAAGGGILATSGLYNTPSNATSLTAASLTAGATVLGVPTLTLHTDVSTFRRQGERGELIADLKESGELGERASSAASSFRNRITGPVRALLALFDRWQIGDASAAILLGAPAASFVSDLRSGISTLNSRDLKDRARLIIGIYEGAHSLMQESDAERLWIKSPVPGLNSQSPFDVMMRGSISDLLLVKSFVDYANGR